MSQFNSNGWKLLQNQEEPVFQFEDCQVGDVPLTWGTVTFVLVRPSLIG